MKHFRPKVPKEWLRKRKEKLLSESLGPDSISSQAREIVNNPDVRKSIERRRRVIRSLLDNNMNFPTTTPYKEGHIIEGEVVEGAHQNGVDIKRAPIQQLQQSKETMQKAMAMLPDLLKSIKDAKNYLSYSNMGSGVDFLTRSTPIAAVASWGSNIASKKVAIVEDKLKDLNSLLSAVGINELNNISAPTDGMLNMFAEMTGNRLLDMGGSGLSIASKTKSKKGLKELESEIKGLPAKLESSILRIDMEISQRTSSKNPNSLYQDTTPSKTFSLDENMPALNPAGEEPLHTGAHIDENGFEISTPDTNPSDNSFFAEGDNNIASSLLDDPKQPSADVEENLQSDNDLPFYEDDNDIASTALDDPQHDPIDIEEDFHNSAVDINDAPSWVTEELPPQP